jgi:DNA-binding HxlR family transcriptional regulator
MTQGGYLQFCPIAMASEVLGSRWTLVLLRELLAGSTRFNDLRRGVPRMSPALLSKRLKELEEAGIVQRVPSPAEPGVLEYQLTRSGKDMKPIIEALGIWGQRWIKSSDQLRNPDVSFFMWSLRQLLDPSALPPRRCTIQFLYPEQRQSLRRWWVIAVPDSEVDVCVIDPGFDVDLYVTADLRTMVAIWVGLTTVQEAIAAKKMMVIGDTKMVVSMQRWLGLRVRLKTSSRIAELS